MLRIHTYTRDGTPSDILTAYRGFEIREDVNGIFTIFRNGKDQTGMTFASLAKAKEEVDELVGIVNDCDCGGTK